MSPSSSASDAPTGASPRAQIVGLARERTPLPSPIEAYFEVANRCNSKCATCPLTFSPQEDARHLSLDEFVALVDQMPELRRAVLQGVGEPLLNRDLPAMIEHLTARGVYTVFNTNAALLTPRRQADVVRSGLHELRVSLDGANAQTYAAIRGIPVFDRVVEHVAGLVQTRARMRSMTPRIALWMTGLQENLSELPDLVDLAGSLGVEEVYLQRLVYWGEGLASADHSLVEGDAETARRIIADAEARADRQGITLRAADALTPREMLVDRAPDAQPWRACSRPLRLVYITAQGTALPCCIAPFTGVPFDELKLGNYLDEGVENVWTGRAYTRFRERLYSADPPPPCRKCGSAWTL